MKMNKRNFLDYFLITLFIGTGGVPALATNAYYIIVLVILLLLWIKRRKKIDSSFIYFLLLLTTVVAMQVLDFSFFSLQTYFGLYIRIITAYFIVRLLEENFVPYFIKVMYILTLISLSIYLLILISPGVGSFIINNVTPLFSLLNPLTPHSTILVYNLSHIESLRNSGPFWEPGAFGGYLIISLILYFLYTGNIFDKKGKIFIIAILTTVSTTAYIGLGIFLFFYFLTKKINIFLKIILVIFLLVGSIQLYTSLDFLSKKIERRIEIATGGGYKGVVYSSRFLDAINDIKDLEGHYLFGLGLNQETRYKKNEEQTLRTNGLTDLLAKMGIIFFLTIFYMINKSYKNIYNIREGQKRTLVLGSFLTTMIVFQSEAYFNYSLIWMLIFIHYSNNIHSIWNDSITSKRKNYAK